MYYLLPLLYRNYTGEGRNDYSVGDGRYRWTWNKFADCANMKINEEVVDVRNTCVMFER